MADLRWRGDRNLQVIVSRDIRSRIALELEQLQNLVSELGKVDMVTTQDITRLTRVKIRYELACKAYDQAVARAATPRNPRRKRINGVLV